MFVRIFFFVSMAAALALGFWQPTLLPFFPLIGIGLSIVMTALALGYLLIVSLFCNPKKPFEKDNAYLRFLTYYTMDSILAVFRFRLHGVDLDKMPDEPCVLVSNHLSRFDPMAKMVLLKKRKLAFISKKENMKILIAGPIIQKIGFLPLDRENPIRSMRTLHKGAKLVQEHGFTMGIYPEGTRSKTGELLAFKTGAFVMAKKAKSPLVITSIRGTNQFKKNLPFRTTPVTFKVLEVIPAEKVEAMDCEELSEYCRNLMAQDLKN